MTQQDAIDAFMALLNEMEFVGDIVGEGQLYRPNDGQPYVGARMSAYTSDPIGFGANCVVEYSGTFSINVHTPGSFSRAYGGAIAGQVAAAFPRGLPVVTATGKVLSVINSSELPGVSGVDWITIPVAVQWFGSDP